MMLGSNQMARVSTEPVSGFVPEFDLCSPPDLIRDTDHVEAVASRPVGATFNEPAEAPDIKILVWFDNRYRDVFNKVRLSSTPEDVDGLKIRVMESPLKVDTVHAMGGSDTPMSFSELCTALEMGAWRGMKTPPATS